MGKFTAGENLLVHLPTKDVQFQAQEPQKLQLEEKEVVAHYLQSDPVQYRVWFDTGGAQSSTAHRWGDRLRQHRDDTAFIYGKQFFDFTLNLWFNKTHVIA